jgi:quinol monooxygenase YgiN
VTTPTDENRNLLTVVAVMRAKAGKEDQLRDALEALIEPTQADAGMVSYNLHQGADDNALFSFYENWESADHLDAHLDTPHLKTLGKRLEQDDLLDGEIAIHRLHRIA